MRPDCLTLGAGVPLIGALRRVLRTISLLENGALMAIRIKTRGNESAEQMMRRFKKLCEKEGLVKDVKRKEYYEKPSERKRRAAKRAPARD